jgi:hypothetical protein
MFSMIRSLFRMLGFLFLNAAFGEQGAATAAFGESCRRR